MREAARDGNRASAGEKCRVIELSRYAATDSSDASAELINCNRRRESQPST